MRARIRPAMKGIAAMALLAGSVSCGDVRQDRLPVIIVIDTLQAASGADPATVGSFLLSDVQTLVTQDVGGVSVRVPVIFNDTGQAAMHLIAKDAGTGSVGLGPTAWNAITLNRYHVAFFRADGRNTPGVDVPFPFDGALTATLTASPVTVGFELVRHQMKLEQPLRSLASGGSRVFISTIAEITFYGTDQVGTTIEARGTISVSFGDYADPTD